MGILNVKYIKKNLKKKYRSINIFSWEPLAQI